MSDCLCVRIGQKRIAEFTAKKTSVFLIKAIEDFQFNNKDPKAELIGFIFGQSEQIFLVLYCFYDAPTDNNEIFNDFLAINHDGSLQTQTCSSFFKTTYFSSGKDIRGRASTVSITKTIARFLQGLVNHTMYPNSKLGSKSGASFIFAIEPFLSTFLDQSQGGAYPHPPSSNPLFPLLMAFFWDLPADDEVFIDEIKSTYERILQLALDDGQDLGGSKQIIYPNYALEETPLSQIYGDNFVKLQSIRKSWDPNNVMYLAGGFKL